MNWEKARDFCQGLGAHLVEIDSVDENEAIADEIKKHSWNRDNKQFWMGLTDSRKVNIRRAHLSSCVRCEMVGHTKKDGYTNFR